MNKNYYAFGLLALAAVNMQAIDDKKRQQDSSLGARRSLSAPPAVRRAKRSASSSPRPTYAPPAERYLYTSSAEREIIEHVCRLRGAYDNLEREQKNLHASLGVLLNPVFEGFSIQRVQDPVRDRK